MRVKKAKKICRNIIKHYLCNPNSTTSVLKIKKSKNSLGDKKKFVTLRSQNKAGATKQKNKIQKSFGKIKK
ncbi:MAG TPA: hypothetical protein PLD12_11710 [Bacteroidales bacterium]|nr:hypothetical protein [Bacteroidales bacterium]HPO66628.1 hypothetical protein [Bacteroidales bacterium]